MHSKLAQALYLLQIGRITVNDKIVSPKEHAAALFKYLDLAGYLNIELMAKAITYLSVDKAFAWSNEDIIGHLQQVYTTSHQGGEFNIELFFENFCNIDGFQVDDIIDLIVFLQQSAFDRNFGVERDKLQPQSLLEHRAPQFMELATQLGVVNEQLPQQKAYCGVAIMGACSARVQSRIDSFKNLKVRYDSTFAITGYRELSLGLDDEEIMKETAVENDLAVKLVEKGEGAAKRTYMDGVIEEMMVEYLLKKEGLNTKISLVKSSVQDGHWRGTTAESAKEIAKILIKEIKDGKIEPNEQGHCHFMIIAEQPHCRRMAMQVQRAFEDELKAQRAHSSLKIIVDGVGKGISRDKDVLAGINSELAAQMAERYNGARAWFKKNQRQDCLRNSDIIMYRDRDDFYRDSLQEVSQLKEQPTFSNS